MAVDQAKALLTTEWRAALERNLNPPGTSAITVSVIPAGPFSQTPVPPDWEWIGFIGDEPFMYAGASGDVWNLECDGEAGPALLLDLFAAASGELARKFGLSARAEIVRGQDLPAEVGNGGAVLLTCSIGLAGVQNVKVIAAFVPATLRMAQRSMETKALKPHLAGLSFSLHSDLGKTTLALGSVLRLTAGSIIDLGCASTDPVAVHLNGRFIGSARVVRCGEYYGICAVGEDVATLEGIAG